MSDSVLEAPARPELANYVGGEWTPARSGRTYEKRNPANPAETVGEFPASGEEDVAAAVEAAANAFPAWSAMPAAARATVLTRAADAIEARVEEMAADMTREMGKPLREARLESARTAAIFRYFAGEAWRPQGELYEQSATGSTLYTLRRPLGVVGLITPWNFPAAIPAWKMAPALVYGNTVVLKLAQEAPLTGLHLAAALDESGIPAGVLNVVIGRGAEVGSLAHIPLADTPRQVGKFLVRVKLLGAETLGPFEGCEGGVVPYPLQVRLAVGCTRRCPNLSCGGSLRGGRRGLSNDGCLREQQDHGR